MSDIGGMGDARQDARGHGSLRDFLGYKDGDAVLAGARVAPPSYRQSGMTLHELSEAQRRFTNYARIRLNSAREYDGGDRQSFEGMEPARLILELRQEIADAVNYLAFLDIQIARWAQRLEEAV